MEAYLPRTGQTAADAGVAARRAIAITRGGVEAAERIRDRALTQRDASRAETAEAKDSVRAISLQMLEQKSQLSLEQDLRHESEAALVMARSDLQEEQQRARKLEAGRAASEARAAELGKTLAKVREQGREAAKINSCLSQEFGLADGECIFESSTGQAEEQLSCCRPPISEVHPISMVCSRSGVRLYAATPRSGPGLSSVRQHALCVKQQGSDGCSGWQEYFFHFLECCGMNSFFLVTQSFSPHRSLVNFLKIHFPMKQYSRGTRHFFWHFLRLK